VRFDCTAASQRTGDAKQFTIAQGQPLPVLFSVERSGRMEKVDVGDNGRVWTCPLRANTNECRQNITFSFAWAF